MRRTFVLCLLSVLAAACSDDAINRPRPDSGIVTPDGSVPEDLALTAGMAFTYRGTLTRRGSSLSGDEQQSVYTFKLTIMSADDNGATGESTLQVVASEWTSILSDDWIAQYEYDSWVGRMGPSLRDDVLGTGAATAHLSKVPEIPPAPTPKLLPLADLYFIDVRKMAELRAGFSEKFATQMPQASDGSGQYRFSLNGPESMTYYAGARRVDLAYDSLGFLKRLDETLGDTRTPPSASLRIELIAGP